MATKTTRPPANVAATPTRALIAMYAGLGLTVAGMLALVLDQATGDVLGCHLAGVYADYPAAARGDSWVLSYLFTLGALGVVSWLVVVRAVRGAGGGPGSRPRWPSCSAPGPAC